MREKPHLGIEITRTSYSRRTSRPVVRTSSPIWGLKWTSPASFSHPAHVTNAANGNKFINPERLIFKRVSMSKLANVIIGVVVSLLLVGVLLPIGLSDLLAYNGTYNATATGGAAGTNSTMATLIGTVIPVMLVITLIIGFLAIRGARYR